ncbi:DUF2345 domain-containing protein, partial [Acinetobacter guillouiae]|uniref:DUF2345 domain-containing protein n=1 Tax=Acinetobacter guillouiae TaxID=106649 RepID=UPI003AF43DEB
FDDTTEQISSQLQSSHGASQLNLGNLSHPKETDTSEGRGEGFELRTDQWGAVRAGQGLLLSTYAQDSASGNHLDATAAKSQLESSLNNSKALSEVAKNQQTDPLENLDHLKSFISSLEKGEFSEAKNQADTFKQALMLLASPNSVALVTNENLHLSADRQIYETAGDSIQLSTQKNLVAHAQSKISLFAAQEGARLFAGKGKVEIQAQGDGADLIARKGIQIISTEEKIEIKADKKIILIADGSQVEISSAGVLPTTAGKFESKAGQHKFLGGQKIDAKIEELPLLGLNYLSFFATDKKGNKLPAGTGYVLYGSDGSVMTGKLSEDGFIKTPPSSEPKEYTIILDDPRFDIENKNIEEDEL